MSKHIKTWIQQIPVPIDEAWDFFSMPRNLARITPPEMRFGIVDDGDGQPIREGQVLTYTLYPIMLVPVRWKTEILRVSRPDFFEDRQIEGPYESWLHRHEFRSIEGGVEMTDIVTYSLPLGLFGEVVEALIVGRRLDEVFAYRRHQIATILGAVAQGVSS